MRGFLQQDAGSFTRLPGAKRVSLLACLLLILTVPLLVVVQSPHGAKVRADAGTFPDPTNFTSPYGFTLRGRVNATLVNEYSQLGVYWVRNQILWNTIELSPGVYTWDQVDQQVQFANANHIHLVFVIQKAPSWHLSITCPNGYAVFGASDVTGFATALASRYNGLSGHGYIDAYEIGNEEFAAYTCKSGRAYAPVLKAGYQTIKAQSPKALVGMFGFLLQQKGLLKSFMTAMYQAFPNNDVKNYFDYANFHYYSSSDPSLPVPGQPNFPTFNEKWQIEQSVMAAHGDGNKPIWVTEIGWPNANPQLQSQAMQYVFDQARLSKVIQKVFWYSINWDKAFDINPGDITPGMQPQPAFSTYQSYVQQYPSW